MKIRTKIVLPFVLVAAILISVGFSIFYYYTADGLEKAINNRLEMIGVSQAKHIETFLDEQKQSVELMTLGPGMINLLSLGKDNSKYALALDNVNVKIRAAVETHNELYEVFLLDTRGVVVASTDESNVGLDRSDDDYFVNAQEKSYVKDVYHSETTGKDSLAISAPVRNETGEILGVLVARSDTSKLDAILIEQVGWGKTGESYLINKNYLMITPSRFISDTFLKQKIDTVSARNCFNQRSNLSGGGEGQVLSAVHTGHGVVEVFPDYRGVAVLGAHTYIPEMDWCLLTEFDEKEAFVLLENVRLIAVSSGFVMILIFAIVAYLLGRSISRPIIVLSKGAGVIAKGDLDYQVGTNASDEIGQLSRDFDKMTLAIKKSRFEIDTKVEEQTAEIRRGEKDQSAQQKAILNILEDVAEEKDMISHERNKIDKIIQSIGDGVFVVNKDRQITMFNHTAEEITGFFAREARGQRYDKILKFVREDTGEQDYSFVEDVFQHGKLTSMDKKTLLIRKDGTSISVGDSAAPLRDSAGNVIGCVVIFRDVTKERDIDKMKTEFVLVASHQLRTPLSAIKWFLELVLGGDLGKLNDGQAEHLREAYKSNQRMITLVNDLLNVSRIESGRLTIDPQPTDIAELSMSVIKEIEPILKPRKQKITVSISRDLPSINVDPKLIRQVIENILSNASRYSKAKSEIEFVIDYDEKDVQVKITDHGYGIPRQQQGKVFQKFFRADNAVARVPEGTGLGLYVAKSIIEASGGEIWFKSKEDEGTTFWFTLPIKGSKAVKGGKSLV